MSTTPPSPPHHRLRAVAPVLAAVLLAACGQSPERGISARPSPDGTATDPTTEPTAPAGEPDDVDNLAFTDCEADRYTVGYPEKWNTNSDAGLLGPCEIFHPGDIEVPERARDRDLHYAVSVYVDEVDFDDRLTKDDPNEVIEGRETTVDGHRAHVVEYRSTGDALVPEGEHGYTWTVDLNGEILVATTSTVGETDYGRDKDLIDRMITEELTIHDETSMIDAPATIERSTEEPDGRPLVVTDVRVGTHDTFDRLVFDIAGEGEAGWLIEYEDDPRTQGSGHPVKVAGDAVLRVALRHMAYPADAPAESYDGPERIRPDRTDAIVEVAEDTLYEGYHDFFVGLDAERPYRVERLTDPQRIVVDIETDRVGTD